MINRIKIENFKSIQKMDLELRPINLLIGANGAGKSNFIGFFKLLKGIFTGKLQSYLAEEGGADNVLYYGLKGSEFLQGEINFDQEDAYSFALKPNKEGDLHFEHEENRWGYTHVSESKNKESFFITIAFSMFHFTYEQTHYFKIFHFHDTSKTAKIRLVGEINDNEFLREDGGNLAAYLYFLQIKHPKDFKKIEMTIQSVAPYFEGFNLKPDRRNEDFIRLEWKEKGSDKYFNASHLSDGTLRFMALVTLLLQPEAPKVIIIDEPELGLHPFAINKLAALIKKASEETQIIISTQSVNLVDNFEPEDIITVDRKDNQSVFKRPHQSQLRLF